MLTEYSAQRVTWEADLKGEKMANERGRRGRAPKRKYYVQIMEGLEYRDKYFRLCDIDDFLKTSKNLSPGMK